ncbi:uncharacterized protein E0L32_004384 [Thyridium curvatum]|uniref:Apurinic-apyrimidinic endonuclease 1 n=1 Tax=Thyridium curvatum TaxID=1093900 RepID=A0A507B9W9_9PEZI|nr:uncharacterized protein E0L32_004384 [Thyridium curvatum]TPX15404.1 hypothetical protein E0L32_004384 [Thyridium curvatum]
MPRLPRKAKNQPAIVEEDISVEEKIVTKQGAAQAVATVKTKVKIEKQSPRKRKAAAIKEEDEDDDFENIDPAEAKETKKPAPKKRKTKVKEEDAMPLAARTAIGSLKRAMYIGAHVSGAGGVQNSVGNAVNIGANAFALFLKSQRKWANPPLAPDARDGFLAGCSSHGFDAGKHCVPHGSYLVNLAQADRDKAAQAYDSFVDDLQRCEALGIGLYNFHPGSTNGDTKEAAIGRIAAQLNRSHRATASVVTVIENMCGSGNVVGSRFEELRDIIAQVDDKSRVGVCIDTCHAFAAGYDLRTPQAFAATMAEFDRVVGARYLRAFHVNDSKAPLGSHRDLHANIGTGFLGLRAFHSLMNHEAFQDLPMVLETPIDRKGPDGKTVEDKGVWAREIKLLESLIGMDPDCDEFKAKEKELQAAGAEERGRIQAQVDKKADKDAKKDAKPKKGTLKSFFKKKKKTESDDEDESD